jgi:histidinol-phosphatase
MYEEELSFANELADLAGEIGLGYFGGTFEVRLKPDRTPVTEADIAIEAAIREAVKRTYPDDAVLGEEAGSQGRARRRWIVDPIDGTRNFARGVPVWATLIALEEAATVQVGVVSAPALGRRWWAERGRGAFVDGERIGVSSVERVEDAVLSFAYENLVPEIAARAWHARGFGDFWAHMLVAEGAVDGAVDATGVNEWDLAAVQVIVEEAGGRFTDLEGVARFDGGSALASNGLLHDELLESLAARKVGGG